MRSKNGFTLVETIVVVMILAVLAGIGVYAYTRYIDRAAEKACLINRTEAAYDYADFVELFDLNDDEATRHEYLEDQGMDLGSLCPGGGTCSWSEVNGRPCIVCSLHAD